VFERKHFALPLWLRFSSPFLSTATERRKDLKLFHVAFRLFFFSPARLAFFSADFCVFKKCFLDSGLGLAFFFWTLKSLVRPDCRMCLDNTLKIRKPEIGIISAAQAGRGRPARFLIYAYCAISIFTAQEKYHNQPFHCATPFRHIIEANE
jgi:hypothetical protein